MILQIPNPDHTFFLQATTVTPLFTIVVNRYLFTSCWGEFSGWKPYFRNLNQLSLSNINMQQLTHYFLHFIFPIIIARFFYRDNWFKSSAVLLLTMMVDFDHLLADPIFQACRCSIGFHPLHSYFAILVYLAFLIPAKTRLIAIGLLMHMATDQIDCFWNSTHCK